MLFGDLSSIITISDVDPFIHILHASLGDFLLDSARSMEFYIDLSSIHTTCMHLCFQHNKQCMSTYFSSKELIIYLHLIDSVFNDDFCHGHFIYAGCNLLWHCENTPPSAYSQLHGEIRNFSFHRPDSCFITPPGMSFLVDVPRFLQFIKTLVCPLFFCLCTLLNTWSSPLKMLINSTIIISQAFSISLHLSFTYTTQAPDWPCFLPFCQLARTII